MELAELLWVPLFIIAGYAIFILVKKQSEEDEFFYLHKNLSQEALIRRVDILAKIHNRDYSKEKEKINRYFLDGKLSEKELEYLEDIITRTYFDYFRKGGTSFAWRASGKFTFISLFLSGIMSVAVVISYVMDRSPGFSDFMTGLLASVILFPFTYIMVLFSLGLLSFLLSILRFVFPVKGSLLRATVFSEEFIKALKPGGRSTQIVLPPSRIFPTGTMF
ncbi:MAG: hypothetical protein IPM77_01190 [Crocinitomicaceae bacterium]|nr:hypothetical protein [Crocinitomicaceae bacterium]